MASLARSAARSGFPGARALARRDPVPPGTELEVGCDGSLVGGPVSPITSLKGLATAAFGAGGPAVRQRLETPACSDSAWRLMASLSAVTVERWTRDASWRSVV
jgi:hypothetical protein